LLIERALVFELSNMNKFHSTIQALERGMSMHRYIQKDRQVDKQMSLKTLSYDQGCCKHVDLSKAQDRFFTL
jgi:hypothetical protein